MNATPCPSTSGLTLKQEQTRDFDQQATLLRGWNQHYAQLSPGHFRGAIVELLFDDIHLFMESTSHALYQNGKLGEDAIALGIPMRATGHGLFCGSVLAGGAAPVFSGRDGFEFYSPDQLTMGGMVASRRALAEWLPERALAELDGAAHLKEVSPQTLAEAGRFLNTVFDLCRRSPGLQQSAAFRQRMRDSVYACMADVLTDCGGPERNLSPGRRATVVQQARDHIDAAGDEQVGIEDLCRELMVSRRTLQYCFQEALGMNPAAFIRARRLNQVRHLLKEVDSVTEAATAWGFWHFGHFSQEYKKLFGELPSDTLRRHHADGERAYAA
jgi:AraC family ethanolamine operon transcriptional activator